MKNLYDKLKAYENSDHYGFHMPGHKRNTERFGNGLPYGIDITEIDGFDDLHHARDLLKDAQERAARLYGAEESHFLVNGSTVGILSAILGTTDRGDRILVGRNCHKSVYHAIALNGLRPVYLYPAYEEELQINGEISCGSVEQAFWEYTDIKAVVLVSPTYDGVLSDIGEIARIVHKHGIPLIVDEAHGAHFGFHPYFPKNANAAGADIVIHSVHKTLPSLTQTALLHLNGTIANRNRVRACLHMLQSSSPSYVLMASIDACMELLEQQGERLFDAYVRDIEELRGALEGLKHLKVVKTERFDRSKFIISVKDTDLTAQELSRILLEEYHLQMEMSAGSYVLAMTSVGDTKEGLDRLCRALFAIDGRCSGRADRLPKLELPRLPFVCTSAEVLRTGETSYVRREEAVGEVSAEYAYIYPPGIPFIVPGEEITQEAADCLKTYEELGFSIEGTAVEKQIGVWKNG